MRLTRGGTADEATPILWDAYTRMKFDAGTIGSEDVVDIPKLTAAEKAWITVANLTDADGKAPFQAAVYKTVKTADGRAIRVGIIGILGDSPYGTVPNPKSSPHDQPWRVADPAETLKTAVPEARKKSDIVVVLYAGTRSFAQTLVQSVPGIDAVVVGLEGAIDERVEMQGKTAIVQNPDRGRFYAQLLAAVGKTGHVTGWDLKKGPMDESVKDDPEAATMVAVYRQKTATPAVIPSPNAPGTTPSSFRSEWAGSFACSSCHAKEFNQWKTTKHAIAMNTLERQPDGTAARRADCVKCHSVAFDRPGGYTLAQPRWDLKGVGCESCHGAAGAHVEARLKGLAGPAVMTRDPGKAVCATCHNPENSPTFDYAKYHAKIVHQ
ncbi:MAG TPA: multiheme c-type cytochrome [Armatimonadota bacterium]|jgi:predicted CxxxxCH...CXXCH cytochrome family protein